MCACVRARVVLRQKESPQGERGGCLVLLVLDDGLSCPVLSACPVSVNLPGRHGVVVQQAITTPDMMDLVVALAFLGAVPAQPCTFKGAKRVKMKTLFALASVSITPDQPPLFFLLSTKKACMQGFGPLSGYHLIWDLASLRVAADSSTVNFP